jgi:hypothetical protein
MTTAVTLDDVQSLFYFDPSKPLIVGYATTPAAVCDSSVEAVSISVQLLDRTDDHKPTDNADAAG